MYLSVVYTSVTSVGSRCAGKYTAMCSTPNTLQGVFTRLTLIDRGGAAVANKETKTTATSWIFFFFFFLLLFQRFLLCL